MHETDRFVAGVLSRPKSTRGKKVQLRLPCTSRRCNPDTIRAAGLHDKLQKMKATMHDWEMHYFVTPEEGLLNQHPRFRHDCDLWLPSSGRRLKSAGMHIKTIRAAQEALNILRDPRRSVEEKKAGVDSNRSRFIHKWNQDQLTKEKGLKPHQPELFTP